MTDPTELSPDASESPRFSGRDTAEQLREQSDRISRNELVTRWEERIKALTDQEAALRRNTEAVDEQRIRALQEQIADMRREASKDVLFTFIRKNVGRLFLFSHNSVDGARIAGKLQAPLNDRRYPARVGPDFDMSVKEFIDEAVGEELLTETERQELLEIQDRDALYVKLAQILQLEFDRLDWTDDEEGIAASFFTGETYQPDGTVIRHDTADPKRVPIEVSRPLEITD